MSKAAINHNSKSRSLPKAATGIQGLDEVTGGGLPRGRPTLVCGSAGAGKTLLAVEFLVRGATEFGEPGVFLAFEETAEELAQNVRSLGFDLDELAAQNKLLVDYVHIERSEIEETGEYDLEGLFIRLGHAIDSIGAKRVVLDTPSKRSSAVCPTPPSCAPSCAGCSAGSRTRGSRRSSPASAATARSPARAWRNTSPTASSC